MRTCRASRRVAEDGLPRITQASDAISMTHQGCPPVRSPRRSRALSLMAIPRPPSFSRRIGYGGHVPRDTEPIEGALCRANSTRSIEGRLLGTHRRMPRRCLARSGRNASSAIGDFTVHVLAAAPPSTPPRDYAGELGAEWATGARHAKAGPPFRGPALAKRRLTRSCEVEAVQVHHFGPRGHEVVYELRLRVV